MPLPCYSSLDRLRQRIVHLSVWHAVLRDMARPQSIPGLCRILPNLLFSLRNPSWNTARHSQNGAPPWWLVFVLSLSVTQMSRMPRGGICFLVLISIRNAYPTSMRRASLSHGLTLLRKHHTLQESWSLKSPAVWMLSKVVLLIGPFPTFIFVVFKLCPLVTFPPFLGAQFIKAHARSQILITQGCVQSTILLPCNCPSLNTDLHELVNNLRWKKQRGSKGLYQPRIQKQGLLEFCSWQWMVQVQNCIRLHVITAAEISYPCCRNQPWSAPEFQGPGYGPV